MLEKRMIPGPQLFPCAGISVVGGMGWRREYRRNFGSEATSDRKNVDRRPSTSFLVSLILNARHFNTRLLPPAHFFPGPAHRSWSPREPRSENPYPIAVPEETTICAQGQEKNVPAGRTCAGPGKKCAGG